jgi:hypothetical protein
MMTLVDTNFSVQDHGFLFPNRFEFSFDFELPFVGSIDLGDIVFGLCGGMCFSALDHYHAAMPIPTQTTVPEMGTDLYHALLDRQIDSFHLPRGVMRVLEWMLREDEDVGRLTTWREIPILRKQIDKGKPVVLALIRVRGIADPTHNHQVVARAYDFDETSKQLEIPIYDPNHPGQEPHLSFNLSSLSSGISPQQSTGEPLRGFFVIPHKPQAPI